MSWSMSQALTYFSDGPPHVEETREQAGRGLLSRFAAPMAGAVAAVSRIWTVLRAPPIGPTRPGRAQQAVDLADARRTVTILRKRVDLSDARIRELEGRLAAFEVDTLELRSRLICLHGKLAATTATARYQTMTLDLKRRETATVGGG